jgi:hypothetical protein
LDRESVNNDVGQIAKEWYDRNEPEGALAAAILRCFFVGTIIRRPGFLLMGETAIYDGKVVTMAPRENANAWFIHFWVSTTRMSSYDLCLEAPFPLEWVCFKRRGKYKALRWEKLYAKDIGYHARNYVST